jgi:hypothetical protein
MQRGELRLYRSPNGLELESTRRIMVSLSLRYILSNQLRYSRVFCKYILNLYYRPRLSSLSRQTANMQFTTPLTLITLLTATIVVAAPTPASLHKRFWFVKSVDPPLCCFTITLPDGDPATGCETGTMAAYNCPSLAVSVRFLLLTLSFCQSLSPLLMHLYLDYNKNFFYLRCLLTTGVIRPR